MARKAGQLAERLTDNVPHDPSPAELIDHGLGFHEFVLLAAGLMALAAVGIDSMLPALPAIGRSLAVSDPNARQWVVTSYILGNAIGQSFYGVLSDRFGRRPVLLSGVAAYIFFGSCAAFSHGFATMLILRLLHGVAAASNVIVRSIIRDCYAGVKMAQVSSLTFIVFLAAPVLAPCIGQLILLIADWRWIFGFLTIFGSGIFAWAATRLPETLNPAHRRPIRLHVMIEAAGLVVSNRVSAFYTLAMTCMMGVIVAFIGSVQQIFADVFHVPGLMAILFTLIAGAMAGGSYLNSRLVGRFGVHRVSHRALLVFIAISVIHCVVIIQGGETLWRFVGLQAVAMACFALVVSNFGSLAMEPVANVAGMAASIQGTISSLGGAILGSVIGQLFNDTTFPLVAGGLLCGIAALGCALAVERGPKT